MPDFVHENQMKKLYGSFVAGLDEVGRGSLFGPVFACCTIILDQEEFIRNFSKIDDSKKLSRQKRNYFNQEMISCGFIKFGLGEATNTEVDQINVIQASLLAMQRAYDNLISATKLEVNSALVDGIFTPDLKIPSSAIIKGDSASYTIAAASVIAKVHRDNLLINFSKQFPEYDLENNSGYGTKKHIAAIEKFGITEFHRKSYKPISEILKLNCT